MVLEPDVIHELRNLEMIVRAMISLMVMGKALPTVHDLTAVADRLRALHEGGIA